MSRSVALSGLTPEDHTLAEAVLSSMPVSFRTAVDEVVDTVVVSGAGDWWSRAREAGAQTVLVLQPEPRRSADRGRKVVLVERFAGNPAVVGGVALPADVTGVAVQVTAPAADPDALVLEAVRTLRSIGITDVELGVAARTASSVVVDGSAGGGRLSLVAAAGPETELRIDVVGVGELTEVRLFGGNTARPAYVAHTSDHGTTVAPSIYENAFRGALRRVATGDDGDDLRTFDEDVATAASIRADG